jgi:hypothetical protein
MCLTFENVTTRSKDSAIVFGDKSEYAINLRAIEYAIEYAICYWSQILKEALDCLSGQAV